MQRKTKPSEQTQSTPRSRQRTLANTQLAVAGTNTPLAVQPPLFTPETPQSMSAQVRSSTIVLGRNQQTDAPITLGVEELFTGLHVLGIPRHGKTALLINVFLQLARQGHGVCYVDPHGDAITDILARLPQNRVNDVIILDPTRETHAFGLNLLTCDNPASDTAMTYAYNQLWSVFNKLWADKETGEMGIWMQKFVSSAILTFLEHPGMTVADIPLLLKSKGHREHFARSLKNREVAGFWLTEFDSLPKNYQWVEIESTLTRLNRFLQNPILRSIVGQSQSTLRFRQIIDTKKLLLVKIPRRLPDDFKNMLGTMLVTQLLDAMFSRDDIPKSQRVPFFLIVDEVERFAVPEFGAFFEEGGKYRVGTVAAHQHLFQEGLSPAVRNSLLTAGNKVYLRTNDTDAEIVAPGFAKAPADLPVPTTTPADILPYLKTHQHSFVRWVWRKHIAPLEEALAKEGIRYDKDVYMNMLGDRVVNVDTIYPEWDFGSGRQEYEPDIVRRMRVAWNTLLCEAVEQELSADVVRSLWLKVVIGQSYFLNYQSYARFLYNNQTSLFTASAPREEITEYERLKAILESFGRDDSNLMHFFHAAYHDQRWDMATDWHESTYKKSLKLFHGYEAYPNIACARRLVQDRNALPQFLKTSIGKSGEEIKRFFIEKSDEYRMLAERYSSLSAYLAFLIAGYKELYSQITSTWLFDRNAPDFNPYKYREDFDHLYQLDYRGSPCLVSWSTWYFSRWSIIEKVRQKKLAGTGLSVDDSRKSEGRPFHLSCSIAEAKEGLSGEEAFLQLLAEQITSHDRLQLFGGYQHVTPKEVRQVLTEKCRRKHAFYEPRNTPAKLLAATRIELEAEIEAIETKLQPLYQQYDSTLAYRQAHKDRNKAEEKSRHDNFVSTINELLTILKQPQYAIRVVASNYDQQGRRDKTAREMIDLMAMELRSLPKYTAFCKLVDGTTTVTHRLDLLPLPDTHSGQVITDMTACIWERMEKEYYRSKETINNEITRRQHLPSTDTGAFVKLPKRTQEVPNAHDPPH